MPGGSTAYLYTIIHLPLLVHFDLHVSKLGSTAVKKLAVGGNTLKLDLVAVMHFFSNRLDLVTRQDLKNAPSTVLLLQVHLMSAKQIHASFPQDWYFYGNNGHGHRYWVWSSGVLLCTSPTNNKLPDDTRDSIPY